MLPNRSEKIPYIQVKQKLNPKVKNVIKNTPSKLHHIHQRRGYQEPRQISKMEISGKIAKKLQSLTVFANIPISEVWPSS